MQIPELFSEAMALAERMGVRDINKLSGCWEVDLADGWKMAVNGHADAVSASFSAGVRVPPYHALFVHPDYFGAIVLASPDGGLQVGQSEDAVLEALRKTASPA